MLDESQKKSSQCAFLGSRAVFKDKTVFNRLDIDILDYAGSPCSDRCEFQNEGTLWKHLVSFRVPVCTVGLVGDLIQDAKELQRAGSIPVRPPLPSPLTRLDIVPRYTTRAAPPVINSLFIIWHLLYTS